MAEINASLPAALQLQLAPDGGLPCLAWDYPGKGVKVQGECLLLFAHHHTNDYPKRLSITFTPP